MIYSIQYISENSYSNASNLFSEYLIVPFENEDQQLVDLKIVTKPNCNYSINFNKYGFKKLSFLDVPNTNKFELNLYAQLKKKNNIKDNFESSLSKQTQEILNSFSYKKSNYFFLKQTSYTDIKSKLDYPKLEIDGISCYHYCLKICSFIYGILSYVVNSSTINTTAEMTLQTKKGVCQDFAHVFIGIMREEGLACRYVSGYLYVNDQVSAQLHAWVEVMLPQMGWIGFDPANNCLINEKYIKIAHGIDYSECTSLKGLVFGSETNDTNYKVFIKQQQQSNQ